MRTLTQKISFLFFLMLLFSTTMKAKKQQSRYKCAYKLEILRDTIKQEYFRPETYIVQINDDITKGFTYQKFYNDSLKKANPELYRSLFSESIKESITAMRATGDVSNVNNNSFSNGAFASTLYKDYTKNELKVVDHISIHYFVFTDELQSQDWELQTDTMTILGYPSQKATCHYRGRNWVAWFTSEIPISEGPWKFYGLPGLITKVSDDKEHYSFTLTGFQEIEEPIDTNIPKKVEKTTREEFIKAMKGGQLHKADMEKVGLPTNSNDEGNPRYDYIETDYKEWEKGK